MTLGCGERYAVAASTPWNDECFDRNSNEEQEKGVEEGQWVAHVSMEHKSRGQHTRGEVYLCRGRGGMGWMVACRAMEGTTSM